MTTKRLSLRRTEVCSVCGVELVVGTNAWWDSEARAVTCEPCHAGQGTMTAYFQPSSIDVIPSPPIPDLQIGVAGQSALEEFERRHEAREARIDAKFGRLAGVVKFLTDDPQSITAWKKGSVGERKLASSLEQSLGDHAILLNDRQVPKTKGNIDHLVVAGSGVWVVDAKNYAGLVQQRDVGGFFKVDNRLYVGGRDRTKVIDGLGWQVRAVTNALAGLDVAVSSAVCFTDAEWGWFAKPFTIREVFVSGPNALARRISETSVLSVERIQEIAVHLSGALPAKE
jgi:hypothetical protein